LASVPVRRSKPRCSGCTPRSTPPTGNGAPALFGAARPGWRR
jgi:hypothetical protein